MVIKVSETQQAWVKVTPKPRRVRVDPVETKESLCAPLRYFSCTPMGSKDRIRMLSRPVSGMSGMVDVNRAPSPVGFNEGAGLMFENGSRGGGRRIRRLDRIVSEPVRSSNRYDEDVLEVQEEVSVVEDDRRSRRSHRPHRPNIIERVPESSNGHDDAEDLVPIPLIAVEEEYSEILSNRSASPPPASIASHRIRRRDPPPPLHQPRQQYQSRTVSTPLSSAHAYSSPVPRSQNRNALSSSGYKFESAIFQPKPSSNHYRDAYRNKSGGNNQGGSWASATSALDFN